MYVQRHAKTAHKKLKQVLLSTPWYHSCMNLNESQGGNPIGKVLVNERQLFQHSVLFPAGFIFGRVYPKVGFSGAQLTCNICSDKCDN